MLAAARPPVRRTGRATIPGLLTLGAGVAVVLGGLAVSAGLPTSPGGAPPDATVTLPEPSPADPSPSTDEPGVGSPPVDLADAVLRCRVEDACHRWSLPDPPPDAGRPAITPAGHLVAVTVDGLAGFEVAAGTRRWTATRPLASTGARTVVAVEGTGDAVVTVGPDGMLGSLDAASGDPGWSLEVPGAVSVRAARAEGTDWHVAVRTRDGLRSSVLLLTVDATRGSLGWQAEAANVALTDRGPVLQDTEGTLWALDPADGTERWRLETGLPGATPQPLGPRVVMLGQGGGLVVDATDGRIVRRLESPVVGLYLRDGVALWADDDGVAYLDADGRSWQAQLEEGRGCCNGFRIDGDVVTTLSSTGDELDLDRDTGELLGRRPAPRPLGGRRVGASLHGELVVVPGVGRARRVANLHDAASGRHLADVGDEAYGLVAAEDGRHWLVLAPRVVLTLTPSGAASRAAAPSPRSGASPAPATGRSAVAPDASSRPAGRLEQEGAAAAQPSATTVPTPFMFGWISQ
ncbi:hypothetical protein GCM10011354_25210 [Egicoccus halophilus]|uniref:Pyrrolo-quinoline quinone repeat domain-containing protein n=1 Tax=Egicoccus halophilus TaxID=1670830 RepID=A0A8J3ESL6_9ACTN|nr:hypothetical protein GCM10011354_25210 [Egicoccus halophilus]